MLKLLYFFLKWLVRVCVRIYYPDTRVLNRDRLRLTGPTLLVSNHPNTLLDPLHVVARANRMVYFLANAGVFKYAFTNWLFTLLWCIPIKRSSDDTGRQVISNEDSFEKSYAHLRQGGNIFIAPEGGSMTLRRLHELRTGTARIGLGAEAGKGFELGVTILPVGLNYTRARRCGEGLVMEVGRPIRVADWRKAYEQDPVQAARDLTDALEAALRSLVYLHCDDDDQDRFLHRLEELAHHDQRLTAPASLERSRALLERLQTMQQQQPEAYAALWRQLDVYYQRFRAVGLTDQGIAARNLGLWSPMVWIGALPAAYGWLNHLAAYQIPRYIWCRLQLYPTYASTVKVMAGLIFFPLGYGLQYTLAGLLLDGYGPLWYLLSLPLSGWVAWQYGRWAGPRWAGWRYRCWRRSHAAEARALETMRTQIMSRAQGMSYL